MTAVLAGPHIGGAWATPSGGRVVDVINPATEEPIGQARLAGAEDIDRAVRAARAALGPWSAATPDERAAVLARAAELIGERSQEIAHTITLEVGSPRAIAEWQPLAGRLILEWHAAQAATFPWEQEREGLRSRLLVRRQPVGVVGAIAPWNFPFALSLQKLAPALLTGCTVVLKPPQQTPLFGAAAAAAFPDAGPPPGVLNVLPARPAVGGPLVRHPPGDKISFNRG